MRSYKIRTTTRLANELIAKWPSLKNESEKFSEWDEFIADWCKAMEIYQVMNQIPMKLLFHSLSGVGKTIGAEFTSMDPDQRISACEVRNAIAEQFDEMAIKTGVIRTFTLPRECNCCGKMLSLNDPAKKYAVTPTPLRYTCEDCF